MINPETLQTSLVDKLRAIPDLVNFIGDMADIQAYDDESVIHGDPERTEFSMIGRAVMLFWTGAELPRMGETRGWKHQFKLAIKAHSITEYFQIAQLIMDGVPVGEFDSFLNSEISPLCDGIQDVSIQPDESDGTGRLSITFSIYER